MTANRVATKYTRKWNGSLNTKANRDATAEYREISIMGDIEELMAIGYETKEDWIRIFNAARKLTMKDMVNLIDEIGMDSHLFKVVDLDINFCKIDKCEAAAYIRYCFFMENGGAALGLMSTHRDSNPEYCNQDLRNGYAAYNIYLSSKSPVVFAHELAHAVHYNHSDAHTKLSRSLLKKIISIILK